MSELAEITVQYVNPPKEGKKWGNVKSSDGTLYWGSPAALAQVKPRENCKLEYDSGGKDGTLKSIKKKIEIAPALQRPTPAPIRGRTNPTDSEQIFVVAIIKGIATADMSATEGIALVNLWRGVYRNTFGGSETNRADD